MQLEVVGVHPVEAPEPCYLIELIVHDSNTFFSVDEITQEEADRSPENWQVPWDEHFLNMDGTAPVDPGAPDQQPTIPTFRVAFFFHYLDFERPLMTPTGLLPLPKPSPRPSRLAFIQYESPC
jgi:hypothetical protein